MKWLDWLLGRSDIHINDNVYMRRWRFLRRKNWGVRVHHILRPDADRELHDHPFDFTSIILSGGYWEYRPPSPVARHYALARTQGIMAVCDACMEAYASVGPNAACEACWEAWNADQKCTWYGPGEVIHRKAEDLHRLVLPQEYTPSQGEPCGYIPPLRYRTTWTLVFRKSALRRKWGFMAQRGWVRAKSRTNDQLDGASHIETEVPRGDE